MYSLRVIRDQQFVRQIDTRRTVVVLACKCRQTCWARAQGAVPSGPRHLARHTRRLLGFCAVTLSVVFWCGCSDVSNTARMVEASFGSVSVTLTPSITGSAPVGTTVVWTASAQDSQDANATFTYQFSVGRSGQPLQRVLLTPVPSPQ
jgi:hypothetical protein